jgi:hypothetical protein
MGNVRHIIEYYQYYSKHQTPDFNQQTLQRVFFDPGVKFIKN